MARYKRLERVKKAKNKKPVIHLYFIPGELMGIPQNIIVIPQNKPITDYAKLPPGGYARLNKSDEKKLFYEAYIHEKLLQNGIVEELLDEINSVIANIEEDPKITHNKIRILSI